MFESFSASPKDCAGEGLEAGSALVFQVYLKLQWCVTLQKQRLEGKGAGALKSLCHMHRDSEFNNSN